MSFLFNPIIKTISEESVKALTIEAVNTAASDVMNESTAYAHLIEVVKDNNGKITMIQANTALINVIARSVTIKAQKNIQKLGAQGIDIPIGSLSGIAFLAGRGAIITFKILPVGSADTSYKSIFTAAGINQTRHRIYMTIKATVSIVVPGINNVVETNTEVLISECIIVGEVPEFYLNGGKYEESMDLTP